MAVLAVPARHPVFQLEAPACLPGLPAQLRHVRRIVGMNGGSPAGERSITAVGQRPVLVMVKEDEVVTIIQFPKNDAAAGKMLQVVFHVEAEMLGNGALQSDAVPVGQPSVIAACFAGRP
jgi:hypothetical protein